MALLGSAGFTYEVSGENWGTLPDGWVYKEATAVAVDDKDEVYVFNRGGHPMIVFDRDGNFLRSWGEGIFTSPHGVTMGPDDTLFCVDNGDHTVRKFTLDGKLLMTLGTKDRPTEPMSGDPFCRPCHVAVDPRNGDFFVADGYGNARVHKYTPDGRLLFSWGESGTDPGSFNCVHNIAADRDGYVYVGDRENRRVQVFDTNGKYQTQWNNLSKAAAVCVDIRGEQRVYVGEYFAGLMNTPMATRLGPRVSIFDTSGNLLARVGEQTFGDEPGRFYSPHGMAVDSRGDVYVAEVSYAEYGRLMDPPQELRSMQKLVRQG